MKRIVAAALVLCLTLSLCGCSEESKTYKQAKKLLAVSEYTQAAELFLSLGDYKDAAEQALDCKYQHAKSLAEAEKPDIMEAIRIYEELGNYSDAQAQKEALQKKYFYPEYGGQIPAIECVISDSYRTVKHGNSEETGSFVAYSYSWSVPDSAAAEELSYEYGKWISLVEKNADGISVKEISKGMHLFSIDGKTIGAEISTMTNREVNTEIILYDNPLEE